MPTQPQFLLFLFILLTLLFIKINSIEQCANDRACPQNYTCSINGKYCCQNETCDLRTKWSLLTNECFRNQTRKCSSDSYCLKNFECVTNKISICDSYSNLMDLTGCRNYYFLRHGFDLCNNFYRHFNHNNTKFNDVMQCGSRCLRDQFYDAFKANETACKTLQEYVDQNFTTCYLVCGMCFVPDAIRHINNYYISLTSHSQFLSNDIKIIATRCNQTYSNLLGKVWTLMVVKQKVHEFIENFYAVTKFDTTSHFGTLLKLKDESFSNIVQNSTLYNSTPRLLTTLLTTGQPRESLSTKSNTSPPLTTNFDHQICHISFGICVLIIILLSTIIVCLLWFKKSQNKSNESTYENASVKYIKQPTKRELKNECESESVEENGKIKHKYERPEVS